MKNIYHVSLISIAFIIFCGCANTKPSILSAASTGDISSIKKYHAEGKDINERDSAGTTALMYAICSKKSDVAKYLIESGADVNAKDRHGYDALRYAIDYKQIELINILLDKGADIESRDYLGRTALAHAVSYTTDANTFKKVASMATANNPRDDAFAVLKLLIKRGANVNAKDSTPETVLELALSMCSMDVVTELINAGASLLIPSEGKARLIFIGEEFFFRDQVCVTLNGVYKYLWKDRNLTFTDVDAGKHIIEIPVSWYQKKVNAGIDAKAGQTYYFMIAQNIGNRAAQMVGGVVGEKVVETASGKGSFFITQMEESVARDKIKAILKSTK